MHMHESFKSRQQAGTLLTLMAAITFLMLNSCNSSEKKAEDTTSNHETVDCFHADFDIAMTVRSLADAIKVGEPLDSSEYDFHGVLTDGQGTPLYTDVQGSPGTWVVDVIDTHNVTIRNVYLGDLLPADLEAYLIQSLHLTDDHKIRINTDNTIIDDETKITIYDFGGGYMRFELRAGIAPNGLEGPLLTIIMSADPPEGDETQIAA